MTIRQLLLILLVGTSCNRGGLPAMVDDAATDGPAAGDGVGVADLSPPIRCGGFAGQPCPMGLFCQTKPGECCCDSQGTCQPIPAICDHIYQPVCGCDGKTYTNDCERQVAGVSPNYDGPCAMPFPCGMSTCNPQQVCYQGCSGTGPQPPPVCQAAPAACNGHPTCACIPSQPYQTCQDLRGGGVLITQTGCA